MNADNTDLFFRFHPDIGRKETIVYAEISGKDKILYEVKVKAGTNYKSLYSSGVVFEVLDTGTNETKSADFDNFQELLEICNVKDRKNVFDLYDIMTVISASYEGHYHNALDYFENRLSDPPCETKSCELLYKKIKHDFKIKKKEKAELEKANRGEISKEDFYTEAEENLKKLNYPNYRELIEEFFLENKAGL